MVRTIEDSSPDESREIPERIFVFGLGPDHGSGPMVRVRTLNGYIEHNSNTVVFVRGGPRADGLDPLGLVRSPRRKMRLCSNG